MGTTNYVAASVKAPIGTPMPSPMRLVGHWNAANTGAPFTLAQNHDGELVVELPGWESEDFEQEYAGEHEHSMSFDTGGFDYNNLCRRAALVSRLYPGVSVTVICENSDDNDRSEDVYRDGKHVLTASSHTLRTTMSTAAIIALAIEEHGDDDLMATWGDDVGNWMADLARRIDAGEVTA